MRRIYFIILSLTLIGFNLTAAFNVSAKQSSKVPIGDILREVPLIDAHNDLPHKLRLMHRGAVGTFTTGTSKFGLSTDAKRMKKGLMGAQFWSAHHPSSIQGAEAIQVTLEQIDLVHRMTEASPYLEMAYTADDVVRIHRTGRIASLIGIEGGNSNQAVDARFILQIPEDIIPFHRESDVFYPGLISRKPIDNPNSVSLTFGPS